MKSVSSTSLLVQVPPSLTHIDSCSSQEAGSIAIASQEAQQGRQPPRGGTGALPPRGGRGRMARPLESTFVSPPRGGGGNSAHRTVRGAGVPPPRGGRGMDGQEAISTFSAGVTRPKPRCKESKAASQSARSHPLRGSHPL